MVRGRTTVTKYTLYDIPLALGAVGSRIMDAIPPARGISLPDSGSLYFLGVDMAAVIPRHTDCSL